MNSRQKRVLIVGLVAAVLMLLFPPWNYFDPDMSAHPSAGYHFILAPPSLANAQSAFRYKVRFPNAIRREIDDILLISQFSIVTPAIAGLMLLFGRRRWISVILGILLLIAAATATYFYIWLISVRS